MFHTVWMVVFESHLVRNKKRSLSLEVGWSLVLKYVYICRANSSSQKHMKRTGRTSWFHRDIPRARRPYTSTTWEKKNPQNHFRERKKEKNTKHHRSANNKVVSQMERLAAFGHTDYVLPEQVPCRQSWLGCMVPASLTPKSKWPPGLWRSWRTYWWTQWSPGGPDTIWPPEGGGEQRRAKSSWFALHRNTVCTPPAGLEDTGTDMNAPLPENHYN